MKKPLLFLGLLAGAAGTAQAQESRFGVKLGPSLTSFTGNVRQADYLLGFHAGVLVNLWVNEHLSIQPEVLYAQKGTRTVNYFFGPLEADVRLHYVDAPILARYQTGPVFLEAGPQVGFLVSGRLDLKRNGSDSYDVTGGYQNMDFGYALGLGLQAQNGLLAGLRYNGGVASIVSINNAGSRGEAPRNSAFQLYVGYVLPRR